MAVVDASVANEVRPSSRRRASWGASASLVTVLTVVISLGNYLFSFLVVHLTNAGEFARFSAAQGLLVVLGSGSLAAIPWAMARFIATGSDRDARQQAMHFGLVGSTLQGIVFAPVAGVLLGVEAGVGVGVVVGVSALIGSVSAAPIGFLQGVDRIPTLAALRGLEFVVRFASGIVILVLVSRSASAALIGYPIGAVVLVVAGLRACRSGLPPVSGSWETIRALVRQSAALGGIQVFITMLGALDTVAVLAAHLGVTAAASYQSAALLGRIPIFLSLSIGIAAYVHVVQARNEDEVRDKMGQAARLYGVVVIPILIAFLTVPDTLLHVLIPTRYEDATALLRFSVISGVAVGWVDVVSTAHQARGRYRPAVVILGVAAIAQPVGLILAGHLLGIWAFAIVLDVVSVGAAIALSLDGRAWLTARPSPWTLGIGGAALAAAIALRGIPVLWLALLAVVGVVALQALRTEIQASSVSVDQTSDQMEQEDEMDVEPDVPAPPRVIILGDSIACPLGTYGVSWGKIAAQELGAEHVLDMSGLSKMVRERLEDADEIRAFAPDIALIACGTSESLMHPGLWMKWILERAAPDTWAGVAGLEPRPYFSGNWRRRLTQRISSLLKLVVKRITIPLGGGRRLSVADFRESLDAMIALLEELDTKMVFVGLTKVDEYFFPYSGRSFADTQAALEAAIAGNPNIRLIDMNQKARYYEDFLRDRLHYNADGHRHVADLVLEASRELLADRQVRTELAAAG